MELYIIARGRVTKRTQRGPAGPSTVRSDIKREDYGKYRKCIRPLGGNVLTRHHRVARVGVERVAAGVADREGGPFNNQ